MLCTVDPCCREIISNLLRHCDILGSCGFHHVTSCQHSVMQFRQNIIKIPSSFTGTFGQSESWSVHISSSWKHPAVLNEVLNDPSCMPDHNTPNLNTNHSDSIAPGKTEACKGELKVSYVTSQKINWVFLICHFLCFLTVKLFFLWQNCSQRYTMSLDFLHHPTVTRTRKKCGWVKSITTAPHMCNVSLTSDSLKSTRFIFRVTVFPFAFSGSVVTFCC